MKIAHVAVGIALGLFASPSLAQGSAATPYGYWVNQSGWVIEAAPCGEEICGHVVGVGGRSENSQRHDIYNADPALRTRPLCGIAIFGDFAPEGDSGEWEGGWIYNPRDGKTYSSNMTLADEDTLQLRGYVISPLFGRTISLRRVAPPEEPCDPDLPQDSQASAAD